MSHYPRTFDYWTEGENMCMRSEREACHYCCYYRSFEDSGPRKMYKENPAGWAVGDTPDYRAKGICLGCKRLVGVSRHRGVSAMDKSWNFSRWDACNPTKEERKAMGDTTLGVLQFDGIPSCPSCGKRTIQVGFDFRAPPKKDRRAWEVLETFLREGRFMVMEGMKRLAEDRPTFRNLLWTRVHVRLRGMHLVNLHVNPILDRLENYRSREKGTGDKATKDNLLAYTYFSSCFRPYRLNHLALPSSKKHLKEVYTDLVQDLSLLDHDPASFYEDSSFMTFRHWSHHLRETRMSFLWDLLRSYVKLWSLGHYWCLRAKKRRLMTELTLTPPHGVLFKEAEARFYSRVQFRGPKTLRRLEEVGSFDRPSRKRSSEEGQALE